MSSAEENFREIFRRLETTDVHIVDINKKMLDIQKDIDDKYSTINSALLKIVGGKNNVGTDASWVRQSVGLTVSVITLLGFFVTIMHYNTQSFTRQLEYESERRVELQSRVADHLHSPWHQKAAEKITAHSEKFESINKNAESLHKSYQRIDDILEKINSKTNSEIEVLKEKVSWTEDEIMNDNAREQATYHRRIIEEKNHAP